MTQTTKSPHQSCKFCGGLPIDTEYGQACRECGSELVSIRYASTYRVIEDDEKKKVFNVPLMPSRDIGLPKERDMKHGKLQRTNYIQQKKHTREEAHREDLRRFFKLNYDERNQWYYQLDRYNRHADYAKYRADRRYRFPFYAIRLYLLVYNRFSMEEICKGFNHFGHRLSLQSFRRYMMEFNLKAPRRDYFLYYRHKILELFPEMENYKSFEFNRMVPHGKRKHHLTDKMYAIGVLSFYLKRDYRVSMHRCEKLFGVGWSYLTGIVSHIRKEWRRLEYEKEKN